MAVSFMLGGVPRAKGMLINEITGQTLEFQFFPEQTEEQRSITTNNANIPGRSHPVMQFEYGDGRSLGFTLYMTAKGHQRDIDADIRWLRSLQYPTWETAGVIKTTVPRVVFVAGKALRFRGVVKQVTVTRTDMAPDLSRTLTATVAIVMEEYAENSVNMWAVMGGADK